jgi:hypothetical protein
MTSSALCPKHGAGVCATATVRGSSALVEDKGVPNQPISEQVSTLEQLLERWPKAEDMVGGLRLSVFTQA